MIEFVLYIDKRKAPKQQRKCNILFTRVKRLPTLEISGLPMMDPLAMFALSSTQNLHPGSGSPLSLRTHCWEL